MSEACFISNNSLFTFTSQPSLNFGSSENLNYQYFRLCIICAFIAAQNAMIFRLKGHCLEHNFKNSTAQKHVYTIGNLLTVAKVS